MDRFIVREPRVGADYPQGHQIVTFPSNSGTNSNCNMIPETMYFGGYGSEFPVRPGYVTVSHVNSPFPNNLPNRGAVMSGIDSCYLAGYADNGATAFISGQQNMKMNQNPIPHGSFANNYENRDFFGAERNRAKTFMPQMNANSNVVPNSIQHREESVKSQTATQNVLLTKTSNALTSISAPAAPVKVNNTPKTEPQLQTKTKSDKLKELRKIGTRVFSGPIEKVLKWHKMLQDLGIMVLYEIVAKCVSIRPGEKCAKNLVVRDDNGPAMQVVYYEIDFLLPELKPPCTIRVVGRMLPGTCRLQAFSVRAAAGDDVTALPRRAAVAAHHVTKLCKECGIVQ